MSVKNPQMSLAGEPLSDPLAEEAILIKYVEENQLPEKRKPIVDSSGQLQNKLHLSTDFQRRVVHLFLRKDVDCMWCQHSRLAQELLHLFAVLKPSENLVRFFSVMSSQLVECCDCIEVFHRVRITYKTLFARFHDAKSVRVIYQQINAFDVKRITQLLDVSGVDQAQTSTKLNQICFALFELARYTEVLKNLGINSYLVKALEFAKENNQIVGPFSDDNLADMHGLYVLLFNPTTAIRNWARSIFQANVAKIDNLSDRVTGFIDTLFAMLTQDSFSSDMENTNVDMKIDDTCLLKFSEKFFFTSSRVDFIESFTSLLISLNPGLLFTYLTRKDPSNPENNIVTILSKQIEQAKTQANITALINCISVISHSVKGSMWFADRSHAFWTPSKLSKLILQNRAFRSSFAGLDNFSVECIFHGRLMWLHTLLDSLFDKDNHKTDERLKGGLLQRIDKDLYREANSYLKLCISVLLEENNDSVNIRDSKRLTAFIMVYRASKEPFSISILDNHWPQILASIANTEFPVPETVCAVGITKSTELVLAVLSFGFAKTAKHLLAIYNALLSGQKTSIVNSQNDEYFNSARALYNAVTDWLDGADFSIEENAKIFNSLLSSYNDLFRFHCCPTTIPNNLANSFQNDLEIASSYQNFLLTLDIIKKVWGKLGDIMVKNSTLGALLMTDLNTVVTIAGFKLVSHYEEKFDALFQGLWPGLDTSDALFIFLKNAEKSNSQDVIKLMSVTASKIVSSLKKVCYWIGKKDSSAVSVMIDFRQVIFTTRSLLDLFQKLYEKSKMDIPVASKQESESLVRFRIKLWCRCWDFVCYIIGSLFTVDARGSVSSAGFESACEQDAFLLKCILFGQQLVDHLSSPAQEEFLWRYVRKTSKNLDSISKDTRELTQYPEFSLWLPKLSQHTFIKGNVILYRKVAVLFCRILYTISKLESTLDRNCLRAISKWINNESQMKRLSEELRKEIQEIPALKDWQSKLMEMEMAEVGNKFKAIATPTVSVSDTENSTVVSTKESPPSTPSSKAPKLQKKLNFADSKPPQKKVVDKTTIGESALKFFGNMAKESNPDAHVARAKRKAEDFESELQKQPKRKTIFVNAMFEECDKKKAGPIMLDAPSSAQRQLQQKQQRLAEKAARAARLDPKLDDLHRAVLMWDYRNMSKVTIPNLGSVPDTFDSAEHYSSVFEPLLLTECKEQVSRSLEELSELDAVQVTLQHVEQVSDFKDIVMVSGEDTNLRLFSENELVILLMLNENEDGSAAATIVKELKKGDTSDDRLTFLGKLEPNVNQKDRTSIKIRCCLGSRNHKIFPRLRLNSRWLIFKVMNMVTVHREFQAMRALKYYSLYEDIIQPKRKTLDREAMKKNIPTIMSTFSVNEPQAQAIYTAINNDGFILCEGPPGTGKTKTIASLVGAIIEKIPTKDVTENPKKKVKVLKKRILVCAPSNAAIDEIAKRVLDGVKMANGEVYRPKIVRWGILDQMHPSVKEISLDQLANASTDSHTAAIVDIGNESIKSIRMEMDQIEMEHNDLTRKREIMLKDPTLDTTSLEFVRISGKIDDLVAKRSSLAWSLRQERQSLRSNTEAAEVQIQKLKVEIMEDAEVICSTLSGSAQLVNYFSEVDALIVDEAAQSIELSALIPLKYQCKKCILVGDPHQLPPTVISKDAVTFLYSQSLYSRMQKIQPEMVVMLSIQYRMHPEISYFPSRHFYSGKLHDGPKLREERLQPYHQHKFFKPYQFLNVCGREVTRKGHSLCNPLEAQAAVKLVHLICSQYPEMEFGGKIGVITPYKQQLQELKFQFTKHFGQEILNELDINTVDGFQGREADIIIFSCVRAHSGNTVGFLSDIRRMNVALTRARCSVIILGHAASLVVNQHWKDLVNDAMRRNMYLELTDISELDPRIKGTPTNIFRVKKEIENTTDKAKDDKQEKDVSIPAPKPKNAAKGKPRFKPQNDSIAKQSQSRLIQIQPLQSNPTNSRMQNRPPNMQGNFIPLGSAQPDRFNNYSAPNSFLQQQNMNQTFQQPVMGFNNGLNQLPQLNQPNMFHEPIPNLYPQAQAFGGANYQHGQMQAGNLNSLYQQAQLMPQHQPHSSPAPVSIASILSAVANSNTYPQANEPVCMQYPTQPQNNSLNGYNLPANYQNYR